MIFHKNPFSGCQVVHFKQIYRCDEAMCPVEETEEIEK